MRDKKAIFIFLYSVSCLGLVLFLIFFYIIISQMPDIAAPAVNNYIPTQSDKITASNEEKINPAKFVTPILLYHHIADKNPSESYYVSPEIFDMQMKWLKDNGYNVISLDAFYQAAQGGGLPKKPVAITFDDSLLDQYQNAFPILKKYGYTATFFVKMNNISTKGLSWRKLKEMSDAGMLIESHSVNHDDMAKMDAKSLEYELVQSKKMIESNLGTKVNYFCYPGGAFSEETIRATKAAGYLMAFTTRHSIVQEIKNNDSFYQLPRIHIDNEMPTFISLVEGTKLK